MDQQGETSNAIPHWKDAVALSRVNPEAYFNLGTRLAHLGRFAEAVKILQQGLNKTPDEPSIMMALATIRATCPDSAQRSGRQAIELSQRLLKHNGADQVPTLTLLAASYAEAGDFQKENCTAERALQLAELGNMTAAVQQIRLQLELFRAGRPYHQGLQ